MARYFFGEDITLRRPPIITFSILLICIICFGLQLATKNKRLDWQVRSILIQQANHPYYSLTPRFEELAKTFHFGHSGAPLDPTESAIINKEQQLGLIRLCHSAEAGILRQWQYRLGWLPGSSSFMNLFSYWTIHHQVFFLLGNLLFFYRSALALEDRWGRLFFAMFFVGCTLIGGLIFALFPGNGFLPLAGLSVPTAGLIGAHFFRNVWPAVNWQWGMKLSFAWWGFFPIWLIIMLLPFLLKEFDYQQVAVSLPAHLSTFLFGGGIAVLLRHFDFEKKLNPTKEELLPEPDRYRVIIARELRLNETDQAFKLMAEAWQKFPDEKEFGEQFWQQALRMKRAEEALPAGLDWLDRCLAEGDSDTAVFLWRELAHQLPQIDLGRQTYRTFFQLLAERGDHFHLRDVVQHLVDRQLSGWSEERCFELVNDLGDLDLVACAQVVARCLERANLSSTTRSALEVMKAQLPNADEAQEHSLQAIEVAANPVPLHANEFEDPFAPSALQKLRIVPVVPIALNDQTLRISGRRNQAKNLPLKQIKAVTRGWIRSIGQQDFLVLDLFLDHPMSTKPEHRALRIRKNITEESNDDDPYLSTFIRRLLSHCQAEPLPDRESTQGSSPKAFPSVSDFEQESYGVTASP